MGTVAAARYDGYADWYDDWARSGGAAFMAAARQTLEELLPDEPGPVAPGPAASGLAVDLGCGTGLHDDIVQRRGFRVLGMDYSADQLSRLP
ncbi:MAG: hypothetical protein AUI14_23355 [Actinobacteria bacterium 13_2_20CM_2_71_6]|nr:MAG: hypothetical protein AUI14_23355 [Actinobacteria bacterium 13_2_20CM_2_71_6]